MIPRRVHYCWLSGTPLPAKMRRCMATWHAKLPDYEFVLWDGPKVEKIGGNGGRWIRHWISRKNYAFAADYIRIWALWREGGIYLDTDVEVLKPLDALLNRDVLLGAECGTGDVEAAVIGAEAGNGQIKSVLDSFGEFTAETLPQRMKRVLGDVPLLPSDVLSPKDWRTGKVKVTANTLVIHHFAGSWLSRKEFAAQLAGRHLGRWAVPVVRWICHRFEK